jgi:hypothetical protein
MKHGVSTLLDPLESDEQFYVSFYDKFFCHLSIILVSATSTTTSAKLSTRTTANA